jgi:hypothetical protein
VIHIHIWWIFIESLHSQLIPRICPEFD